MISQSQDQTQISMNNPSASGMNSGTATYEPSQDQTQIPMNNPSASDMNSGTAVYEPSTYYYETTAAAPSTATTATTTGSARGDVRYMPSMPSNARSANEGYQSPSLCWWIFSW